MIVIRAVFVKFQHGVGFREWSKAWKLVNSIHPNKFFKLVQCGQPFRAGVKLHYFPPTNTALIVMLQFVPFPSQQIDDGYNVQSLEIMAIS